jgi:hypothetical protein
MQITTQDGQKKIWQKNKMIGYVDEKGDLYGLDRNGYAVRISAISHDIEIIPILRKWHNESL